MEIRYDILYLRFISILSIILYHFNEIIFHMGYIGVDILLIITSYLNINSISRNIINHKKFQYINYIIKKSNRLIPPSLFVLYFCKNYIRDSNEIYSSLFFLSNYYYYKKRIDYFYKYDSPTPILHFWCLSLEYQFYFIIPLIIRNIYKNYIIIVLFVLSLYVYLHNNNSYNSYCYYCLVPRLYQFLISYFIKVKSVEIDSYKYNIIYTILHTIIVVSVRNDYTNLHIIYTTLISCIINYNAMNCNISYFFEFFSNISYSLYLVHYPIIIENKYNNILKILLMMILSLVLYYISDKFILKILNKINNYFIINLYYILIIIVIYFYRNKEVLGNKFYYNPKLIWNEFNKYRHPCKNNVLS